MIRAAGNRKGQGLVIALIVLGVLLVVGFVFLGIINRSILSTGLRARRTLASDLAEAGVREAHSFLLNSDRGADWRPGKTPPISADDPDNELIKTGGPDGLGHFSRFTFASGRALVRIRYAPSDANVFQSDPMGPLRDPGRARNYLIIESIGRPGRVSATDPTISGGRGRVDERKLIAFADIGITGTALSIWNKYNVSRPAELGVPTELGVRYLGNPVAFPLQLGGVQEAFDRYPSDGGPGAPKNVKMGGSLFVNGSLRLFGNVNMNLATPLGEGLFVTDTIIGADNNAQLGVTVSNYDPAGVWQETTTNLQNATSPSLNSRSNNFSTLKGAIRDGFPAVDEFGFPRGLSRKEPPSILTTDPDTGQSRYVFMTRESGKFLGNGNTGRFGHGRGVYVDNSADRQNPPDESGRQEAGSGQSLVYDWLNPNSGQANSGWQGPFYVPRGAFLQLISDGWIITRDGRAPASQRTWRNPDGTDSGSSTIRYRVGEVNGVRWVVNTYTSGVNINARRTEDVGFENGEPFNGVLYFAGNVRVRGVVPTDIQLTVVSNATIYIEGSITKGILRNNVTKKSDGTPDPPPELASEDSRIDHTSMSMIALLAKDYICLNTTQFFGSGTESLDPVNEVPSNVGYVPVRMSAAGGSLTFRAEMLLDPTTNAPKGVDDELPRTWRPYAKDYVPFGEATEMDQTLIVTHTMDDGAPPNAFFALDVNYGVTNQPPQTATTPPTDWVYLFAPNPTYLPTIVTNAASTYFAPGYVTPGYSPPAQPDYLPMYGLGLEPWQRYSKFETMAFPIADSDPTTAYSGIPLLIRPAVNNGVYVMLAEEANYFALRATNVSSVATNDYLLARAALVPHDVRIEALMYAEEGSFFVLPGPAFNPNPSDTRENWVTLGATDAERNVARLENFGVVPETPFFGEPIDVRVQIIGAVAQNMPVPIAQQAEWLKRWGWIPGRFGSTGRNIPQSHVGSVDLNTTPLVPNIIISYDPVLATGRANKFDPDPSNVYVRRDSEGNPLPPAPRLPVSRTLAYFGEVNP